MRRLRQKYASRHVGPREGCLKNCSRTAINSEDSFSKKDFLYLDIRTAYAIFGPHYGDSLI